MKVKENRKVPVSETIVETCTGEFYTDTEFYTEPEGPGLVTVVRRSTPGIGVRTCLRERVCKVVFSGEIEVKGHYSKPTKVPSRVEENSSVPQRRRGLTTSTERAHRSFPVKR